MDMFLPYMLLYNITENNEISLIKNFFVFFVFCFF